MNKKPIYLKQIYNFINKSQALVKTTETINLLYAEDKILAENIYSKIDLPPFKNSAVDGYAILKTDLTRSPKKIFKKTLINNNNKNSICQLVMWI